VLKPLRILFAVMLFAIGASGLVLVPLFAISLANTGLGSAGIVEYSILLVFSSPLFCVSASSCGRAVYIAPSELRGGGLGGAGTVAGCALVRSGPVTSGPPSGMALGAD
jgi:hypothetical protein